MRQLENRSHILAVDSRAAIIRRTFNLSQKEKYDFERTSISCVAVVENGTCLCANIYSAISVGSSGYQEESLRKVAGCFLVALSERCENKRPFAPNPYCPSLSLSHSSRNNIMWFSGPLLPVYFPSRAASRCTFHRHTKLAHSHV